MLVKGLLLATLSYRATAGPASGNACTSVTEVPCYKDIVANQNYGVGTRYEGYAKACFFMKSPESKRFARCVFGLPDDGRSAFWKCRNSIVDDLVTQVEREAKKSNKASSSASGDGKKKKKNKRKGRAFGDSDTAKPQCLMDLEASPAYHDDRVAKACIRCLAKRRTLASESTFNKCVLKAQKKGDIDNLVPHVYDCFNVVSGTQSCDNFLALVKTVAGRDDE